MSQEKLDKPLGRQLRIFVPQTPLTLELQALYSASLGSHYEKGVAKSNQNQAHGKVKEYE